MNLCLELNVLPSVLGWIMVPKRCPRVLIPRTCECCLIWKMLKCNWVKDLERRSSWMMGLKTSDKCPYKRQRRRQSEGEEATWPQMQRCSDAAMSQAKPTATRSWKRQRPDCSLEPPEGVWPCGHLDFGFCISLQNCERTHFCCFKPPGWR